MTIADDDTASTIVNISEVKINPTVLEIVEGSARDYTVVLTSQSTGDVRIMIGGEDGEVSISDSGLTFTASNWDQEQTVTVR